ncbi:MAG: NAD(P)-dependent glycerol-3-phosphate dehydrogenase, partial [Actinomycetia bacterium]|nr:NAD(P)-dependent glycerol-3-phosphate dehydrogenase [Actinomycetes bacterium]
MNKALTPLLQRELDDFSATPAATGAPVAVIGAGSWGSAMAWMLGQQDRPVQLWTRTATAAAEFNASHQNPRYLPGVSFGQKITATADLAAALADAAAVLLVTPSTALADTARSLACWLPASTPVVILSKGLEPLHQGFLSQTLADQIGHPERIAVLSGPNFAAEVARGIPTATVVAAAQPACAGYFQQLLATAAFRVYLSADLTGVQLCGATKNIIAIACGLSRGLGFGDNTAALLMTRGLAEIARLVTALGGQAQTCMGLAGLGDLVATCTSEHSRNRGFGQELAAGGTLASYQQRTHMVVEGAEAARAVT